MEPTDDPLRELEMIRALMERARQYRHPPAPAGLVAGLGGLGGGWLTHAALREPGPPQLEHLAHVWATVFLGALAAVVYFTRAATRREGIAFWSPLAKDVVHALWPPLVAGLALTATLANAGRVDLVPAVWLLSYGIGGIAAGAYARRIVRRMGAAFLAAGLAQLALSLEPGLVLAATFGGFHLAYGAFVGLFPNARESS